MMGRMKALKLYRVTGFVIREMDLAEADKIIVIFSKKHGKLHAIAKGARKIQSKLLAGTRLFTISEFILYKGKNLFTVTQCEPKVSFYHLSDDMNRFFYACYLAEIIDKVTEIRSPEPMLFDIFFDAIAFLNNVTDVKLTELVVRYFEIKLLDLFGYRPEMGCCVSCGKRVVVPKFFNPYKGGVLCDDCSSTGKDLIKLDTATVQLMKYLLNCNIKQLGNLKVSDIILEQLEYFTNRFISYVFERDFKSIGLFRRNKKNKSF